MLKIFAVKLSPRYGCTKKTRTMATSLGMERGQFHGVPSPNRAIQATTDCREGGLAPSRDDLPYWLSNTLVSPENMHNQPKVHSAGSIYILCIYILCIYICTHRCRNNKEKDYKFWSGGDLGGNCGKVLGGMRNRRVV